MNICHWFPSQTLVWLRQIEDCSYYFKDNDDFITTKSVITGFKSHSNSGKNAISLKGPVKKIHLQPHSKGYCAEFSGGSIFKITGVDLALDKPSYAFLVMTFKMDKEPTSEQFILSDKVLNRGLSIDSKTINIYGAKENPLKLTYKHRVWITIGIQWTMMSPNYLGHFYLWDEGEEKFKHGTFVTTKPSEEEESDDLYIGGLGTGKGGTWQACLAALDIHEVGTPSETEYPARLRKLILDDHRWRVTEISAQPNKANGKC